MKKLLLLLFAVFILAGCVSTKTYEDTLHASEARQQSIDELSGELEAQKLANSALSSELEALRAARASEAAELDSRIAALEASQDELTRARQAQTGEIASLQASLANRNKEGEYLTREVERLKIKSGEISSQKEKELANVKTAYENLVSELKTEIEKGDIRITQALDRLSVNLVEKILFDSGKAEIKPDGLKVISRVGDILKKVEDRQIRVEGHTDNVRIGQRIRGRYPTNWELSTARATNVVRHLQDSVGVDPLRLSAGGYSEYRPVESNATAEGKAQNRRIEIVLLPLDVDRVLEELKK